VLLLRSQVPYLIAGMAGVGLLTWGLAGIVQRYAPLLGLVDIPNDRSSHVHPTPRGGGLAIVVSMFGALGVLQSVGSVPAKLTWTLLLGGGLIACIGGLDDRWSVPAYLRLSAHCAAAGLAIALLGTISILAVGQTSVSLGPLGWPLTLLGMVWFLNLFNFMDGIDGIATLEAVYLGVAAGVLAQANGASAGVVIALFLLAASCTGFLPLNWPPARLFLGDVGSGFLGFVLAALAVCTIVMGSLSVWTWFILSGAFFTDATATLLRRSARGERAYEAHRSHAYQWLARSWDSHRRVTLTYLAVNLLWLFPLAWLSTRWKQSAAMLAACAIVPLAACVLIAGAGRREVP
jgi:Fuc2NAc and GlcNAc transferase